MIPSRRTIFRNGTRAMANEVDAEFQVLFDALNGQLGGDNLQNASIGKEKLSFSFGSDKFLGSVSRYTDLASTFSAPRNGDIAVVEEEAAIFLYVSSSMKWIKAAGISGVESHNSLLARDTADSHPIGAITGLETRLAANEAEITKLNGQLYHASDYGITFLSEDNSPLIQYAINDINLKGGGTLVFPSGVFKMKSSVKIKNYTHLKATPNTKFLRNEAIDNLFVNDSDGTIGGYGATSSITIEGGIFDGNAGAISGLCTLIGLGHANNIVVKNAVFQNIRDWHFIEINACKDVLVDNCVFKNYLDGTGPSEAVQIDVMGSSGWFPWFGPVDNTVCQNITVQNCKFNNVFDGIGTHSAVAGFVHRNIKILENTFENVRGTAIKGYDWKDFIIGGNIIEDCDYGITIQPTQPILGNFVIKGNIIRKANKKTSSRAIFLNATAVNFYSQGNVSDNQVYDCGQHSIAANFCKYIVFANNEVFGGGNVGLYLYGCKNCTVNGFIAQGNGLAAAGSKGDILIGNTGNAADTVRNTVSNCNVDTLVISGATETLISGCHIQTNAPFGGTSTKVANTWNGATYVQVT